MAAPNPDAPSSSTARRRDDSAELNEIMEDFLESGRTTIPLATFKKLTPGFPVSEAARMDSRYCQKPPGSGQQAPGKGPSGTRTRPSPHQPHQKPGEGEQRTSAAQTAKAQRQHPGGQQKQLREADTPAAGSQMASDGPILTDPSPSDAILNEGPSAGQKTTAAPDISLPVSANKDIPPLPPRLGALGISRDQFERYLAPKNKYGREAPPTAQMSYAPASLAQPSSVPDRSNEGMASAQETATNTSNGSQQSTNQAAPPPPTAAPQAQAQAQAQAQVASRPHEPPSATKVFLDHSTGTRISTETAISRALRARYPGEHLSVVPEANCNLVSYAMAGYATYSLVPDTDENLCSLAVTRYVPPARRLDNGTGVLVNARQIFAKYAYRWSGVDFIVYFFDGRDGTGSYPMVRQFYIIAKEARLANALILAAGKWSSDLHDEILVFDQGNWTKNKELYTSVRGAQWEDVILDDAMKTAIIEDHLSFFRSRDTYAGLKVPWKRGVIYYGPPGNGKTISIKATMNMLYRQEPEVPTLYVRTLTSWAGPEYSVRLVFAMARQYAPCYLVFEDLDTIVTDSVRSYFLNEVDGLTKNDGIFMVGSTNHIDRLDPGISKRPSRFDRKYYFPDPDLEQRIAYCAFWQKKLGSNDEVEFPDELLKPIAEITDGFSFAYMQEAFVAALLTIASVKTKSSDASQGFGIPSRGLVAPVRAVCPSVRAVRPSLEVGWDSVTPEDSGDDCAVISDDDYDEEDDGDDDDDLDEYVLWVEMKKQVAILREGMEEKRISKQYMPVRGLPNVMASLQGGAPKF